MRPIYIMAVVTVAVALALWGSLIYLFSGRERRYFWLLALGLPLSAIANLVFKRQAIVTVGLAAHVPPGLGLMSPAWFLLFQVLIGPAIEEAIKVTPLLFRLAWKMVTGPASAFWVGFALGVSFGLGEAAFLAYGVAQTPQYSHLPWYAFTGFLNDRLLACFGHGVFSAVLVTAFARGPKFILPGYGAAFGLHFFFNLPVVLYQFRWISIEVESFSMIIPFIVLAVIFERLRRGFSPRDKLEARHEIVYLQR